MNTCNEFSKKIKYLEIIWRLWGVGMKYKFNEWDKGSAHYDFIITEHGHVMMPYDVVKGLNDKELLLKQKRELEKQNEELIECCITYIKSHKKREQELAKQKSSPSILELMDIVEIETLIEKITGKPIEEILK